MSVFAADNWLRQKGTFSSQLNKGFMDRYVCGCGRTGEISGPEVSSWAEVLLLFHSVILGFGIMLTLMTNICSTSRHYILNINDQKKKKEKTHTL